MWKRYLSPTPANVARLLIAIKTVLGTIAGAEMIAGHPSRAFYLMLTIGIVNELANFLSVKPKENGEDESSK